MGYAINVTFSTRQQTDAPKIIIAFFIVHFSALILTLGAQTTKMSIKNLPTQIQNSAHISTFHRIVFFFSLSRLNHKIYWKMVQNKIEIHVECEHHCNNSSLYVFSFSTFFCVYVYDLTTDGT